MAYFIHNYIYIKKLIKKPTVPKFQFWTLLHRELVVITGDLKSALQSQTKYPASETNRYNQKKPNLTALNK